MNKNKQQVIEVLEKLKPYREMSVIFLKMIEHNSLPDQMINDLSKSLHEAIKYAKTKQEKALFISAQETIKKIQQSEKKHLDEKEADDIINSL